MVASVCSERLLYPLSSYTKDLTPSVYDLLFDWMRKDEEQKIGFLTRKFPWAEVPSKPHKWLCELKKDRAVVTLDSPFYWHAHIQHQGEYWKSRYDFKNLEEAVNWVEEELTTLEQMPVEEEKPVMKENRKAIRQRVREKMAQSPYLIKPSDLELQKTAQAAQENGVRRTLKRSMSHTVSA